MGRLMPDVGFPQALKVIRSLEKRVLFLTNNASKSRAQYKAKFDSLGIPVAPEEVGECKGKRKA